MLRQAILSILLLSLFIVSCSTVPITGRKQLSLIPNSQMLSMSFQQYGDFLKTNKISANQDATQMVKRIGGRVQAAVEKYFAQKNMTDQLADYRWEFNLVESNEVNAWCMPGGKVVVYTGILPVTQTEAGLATVMGHEIAHAIAQHGGERMSQELLAQMGGVALATALDKEPDKTKQLWMGVYGLGAQYGAILPYSRLHESEADHLGLIFMAMAGYNPNEAVTFWGRMASSSKGQAPPEFMSTHPSDETRIEAMKKALPEAMGYYQK